MQVDSSEYSIDDDHEQLDEKVDPNSSFQLVEGDNGSTNDICWVAWKAKRIRTVCRVDPSFVCVGHEGGEVVEMNSDVTHPLPPPSNLAELDEVAHDAHEGTKGESTDSDTDDEIGNTGCNEDHDGLSHHETHEEVGHEDEEAVGVGIEANEPVDGGATDEGEEKDKGKLEEKVRQQIGNDAVRSIAPLADEDSPLLQIHGQHGDAHEDHEGGGVEESTVVAVDDLGRETQLQPDGADENGQHEVHGHAQPDDSGRAEGVEKASLEKSPCGGELTGAIVHGPEAGGLGLLSGNLGHTQLFELVVQLALELGFGP